MLNDLISKQSLDFINTLSFHFLPGMLQVGYVAIPPPSFALELYKELQDRCNLSFEISINHECIIYEQYSWNQLVLGIL